MVLQPACRAQCPRGNTPDHNVDLRRITATVVDTVGIRTLHQTQRLVVTAQDVERRYVDVAAGSRFDLKHTGPCLFEFRPVGNLFRAVKVSGLAVAVEFNAEGGTVLQKSSGTAATSVAISYRFQLETGISTGTYPWPLLLTVLPM